MGGLITVQTRSVTGANSQQAQYAAGLRGRRGFLDGNAGCVCRVEVVRRKTAWRGSMRPHDVAEVLIDCNVVFKQVAALRHRQPVSNMYSLPAANARGVSTQTCSQDTHNLVFMFVQFSSVASNVGAHMACAVDDIPAYASMSGRIAGAKETRANVWALHRNGANREHHVCKSSVERHDLTI